MVQLPFMIAFEGHAWSEPSGPEAMGWGPLNRIYRASDGWFYLAAYGSDALVRVSTVKGLEDIEFLVGGDLEAALSARFAKQSAAQWVHQINATGCVAHIVRSIGSLMEDPLVKGRGLSVLQQHPGLGIGRGIGVSARLSSMGRRLPGPASKPGWHTTEILREIGYGDVIEDLVAAGVVATSVPESR